MHPLIGLAQLLIVGFVLYLLSLIVYTMWAITHPHRQTYASALARNLPGDPSELDHPLVFEERRLDAPGGEIDLWDIRGSDPAGPVVIMTHGWGSSRQGALKRIAPVIPHASRVLVWDLPGHGDSGGHTRLGADEHHRCVRVAEGFCDPATPIVLFGWSMGAGVSLAAAESLQDRFRLIGVVCEAPYLHPHVPAKNVIRLKGIPHRLNLRPAMAMLGTIFGVGPRWRGFDRASIAARVRVPILILHGTHDPVCPDADAHAIVDSAPDARFVSIEGGGHNNLWLDEGYREQAHDAVDAFMAAIARPARSPRNAAPARP
ncbi:MAG: alpha/beta fold hydrolase [Phycisphaerales bacterium]